ncbi:MAG: hypothetical protein AAFZ52_09945, partial [Bacteroidota bacterium]
LSVVAVTFSRADVCVVNIKHSPSKILSMSLLLQLLFLIAGLVITPEEYESMTPGEQHQLHLIVEDQIAL